MKLFNFSAFAILIICIAQTYAIGFHCAQHVVLKKGDSCSLLYSGSKRLIRLKDLKIMNPLIDCSKPFTEDTTVCVERDIYYSEDFDYEEYIIEKGDTCEKIAAKLNTEAAILERVNTDILYCDRIEELVDTEIQYRADGDYKPIFENSTEIKIRKAKKN